MTAVANPNPAGMHGKIHELNREELLALSRFSDDCGHAVTFYFKPDPGRSRREAMALNHRAHEIISSNFCTGHRSSGLLRDLDHCLEISEEELGAGSPMKVVFACHERGIWVEFDVPCETCVSRLEADKQFHVELLLKLMEARGMGRGAAAADTRVV